MTLTISLEKGKKISVPLGELVLMLSTRGGGFPVNQNRGATFKLGKHSVKIAAKKLFQNPEADG